MIGAGRGSAESRLGSHNVNVVPAPSRLSTGDLAAEVAHDLLRGRQAETGAVLLVVKNGSNTRAKRLGWHPVAGVLHRDDDPGPGGLDAAPRGHHRRADSGSAG